MKRLWVILGALWSMAVWFVLLCLLVPALAADNYAINQATSGSLTTMGSDEVASVQYARIKNGFGSDGAYTDVSATSPFPVSVYPATAGGCSIARSISLLNTGLVVKASSGQLCGFVFTNRNASERFVKLYNKTTAPAPASDTPVATFPVKGSDRLEVEFPHPVEFTTGISMLGVTGIADTDNTAPSANDLVVDVFYK